MGSFTSKTRRPDVSQYYAAAPVAAAPATNTPPAAVPTAPAETDGDKAAAVVRRRAMPETILTSFRGVLSEGPWMPARKSLLGE